MEGRGSDTDYYIKCTKERCVVASLTISSEEPTELATYDLSDETDRWGTAVYKFMLWQAENPGKEPKSKLAPAALEKLSQSIESDEPFAAANAKLKAAGAGHVHDEYETIRHWYAADKTGCGVMESEHDEEKEHVYDATYEFYEVETGPDANGSYADCVIQVLGL